MNFTIIQVLLTSALGILTANGTVPSSVMPIVAALTGIVPSLIAAFQKGAGAKYEVDAIITGLQTTISALKANTDLSPDALARIDSLLTALQKALEADSAAQIKVDPSTLTDIQSV